MRLYPVIFCFFITVSSLLAQTVKLTQLETGKVGLTKTEGLVGVTNTQGKQRYMSYVKVSQIPIGFTPTATGNLTNLNEFVTQNPSDTVWYIDYKGNSIVIGVRDGGGAGAAANDRDWLRVNLNTIPDSIGQYIYTYNGASVGARLQRENVEFIVNDSTATGVASQFIQGPRESSLTFWRNLDQLYTEQIQKGNEYQITSKDGVVGLRIGTTAAGNPPNVTQDDTHLFLDYVADNIQLPKYPNTRNDAGSPVNVLTTSSTGVVESHLVSEIVAGSDSISKCAEYLNLNKAIGSQLVTDVVLLGDSRTEAPHTPDALRLEYISRYGDAGFGTLNIGSTSDVVYWTKTSSGVTVSDNTGLGLNSIIGLASTFAASSFVQYIPNPTLPNNKFTSIDIWYEGGSGTVFNIMIDGTSVGNFTAAGTGIQKATFAGFTDALHTLRIAHSSGASGTIYEVNFKRDGVKGVRFHRLGNSGFTSAQQAALAANTYLFADITPDLTYIRLGANDLAANTPTTTANNLLTIANSISGDKIILGETDNTTANSANVSAYNTAISSMANSNGFGFINLFDYVSDWSAFRIAGYAPSGDDVHENSNGGYYIANAIFGNATDQTCTNSSGSTSITGITPYIAWYDTNNSIAPSPNVVKSTGGIAINAPSTAGSALTIGDYNTTHIALGAITLSGSLFNITDASGYSAFNWLCKKKSGSNNVYTMTDNGYGTYVGRYSAGDALRVRITPTLLTAGTEFTTWDDLYLIDKDGRVFFNKYGSLAFNSDPTSFLALNGSSVTERSLTQFRADLGINTANGLQGYIPYYTTNNTINDGVRRMYFDATNKRFGVNLTNGNDPEGCIDAGLAANTSTSIGLNLRQGNNGGLGLSSCATAIKFSYDQGTAFSHRIVSRHTGNNNGLYFYNHSLADQTATEIGNHNTLSLVTDASGVSRIGILTETPSATLDVVGSAKVSSLAGSGTRMVTADATGVLSTATIPTSSPITSVGTGFDINSGVLDLDPTEFLSQTTAPTATGTDVKVLAYNSTLGLTTTQTLSDIAKFVNYRDTVLVTRTIFDGSTVLPIAAGIRSEGYWRVPEELDGYTLVRVNYEFFSVPGTGTDYVLVVNQEALGGGGSNLVPLTVSAGSAAHRFVAGATTVVKGDMLRVNVTTAGSAIPSGLVINYVFAR